MISKNIARRFSSKTNSACHNLDRTYVAHNYSVMNPVIARGEDVWLWDVEGRKYLDFHAGYCAVN